MKNGKKPTLVTIRNVFPPETEHIMDSKKKAGSDQLNILYAGTFGRAQNLDNALQAAELARKEGVKLSLCFVGAGVTREALRASAANKNIDISIENRKAAEDLAHYYEWADTALVHLTDWGPLDRAVPSKTYELMASGIHITGVVSGETAELIRTHRAGIVVPPEDPQSLADQWVKLARNRDKIEVRGDGPEWVRVERENVAPQRLLALVDGVSEGRA